MAEAKVTREGDTTVYKTDGQTDLALEIGEAILDIMAKNQVPPHAALGVLGEGVITFLVGSADLLGYDKQEIIKVFGESLVNAEIKIKTDED